MHPIQTLRDKKGQNEMHLYSERARDVREIKAIIRVLTISPAQIPRVCGNTLSLFATCETHQCAKMGESLRVENLVYCELPICWMGATNHNKLLTPIIWELKQVSSSFAVAINTPSDSDGNIELRSSTTLLTSGHQLSSRRTK